MADIPFTTWADLLTTVKNQYNNYLSSGKMIAQQYTHASGETIQFSTEYELRKCLSFVESKALQESNATVQSGFIGFIPARWF